jgi:Ser-tRNA(Ala) deacylase AlaX
MHILSISTEDSPYVEYKEANDTSLSVAELNTLPAQLTVHMTAILGENIETSIHMMNKAEAGLVCNGMDLTTYPEYMRVVKVGDIFIPCGGTHINSTSEIGLDSWTIHKIKKKKKMLRVGYSISDK